MSSVVVGDEGSLVGGADLPVVPDGGGQGEQSLGDAGEHSGGGASAVAFEAELVFEGVEDRFDPLAHPGQVAEPAPFVFAVGPGQQYVDLVGGVVFHLPPEI